MCTTDFTIELTRNAQAMLKSVPEKIARRKIADRIEELKKNADSQGKPLKDDLAKYRSIRATQRYRVVYRIEGSAVQVVAIGLRKDGDKKDVYQLATKLWKSGQL